MRIQFVRRGRPEGAERPVEDAGRPRVHSLYLFGVPVSAASVSGAARPANSTPWWVRRAGWSYVWPHASLVAAGRAGCDLGGQWGGL
jgi:hypothetical protein